MGIVTLLSGGLDSALLAALLKEKGFTQFPLYINYGQINIEKELQASRDVCQSLGLDGPVVIDVSGYGKVIKSGLTDSSLDIVDDAFLPNRNALFLTCAAAYAVQHGCTHIAIGFLNEANHIFPDQTRHFLDVMEQTLSLSLGSPIRIVSPFVTIDKPAIIKLAENYGVNGTYSCHKGGEKPCGQCIACKEFIF